MHSKWFVPFAALALLVIACDASSLVSQFLPRNEVEQAQATLQAVVTSAPAIITSVAPTLQAVQTQAAPTVQAAQTRVVGTVAAGTTPAAPTKAASTGTGSNPFTDALSKAKTATKFRVQVSWVFGAMENGKYAEQPFIDFTGEVDGTKAHMTSKGGLLAMLASDAKTPLEIVAADGKTYMKGVGLFGMADPKVWYITDGSSTSSFADMAKPDEYKTWISGANAADIKKVRSESFDNQSCDVYLYDMKSLKNPEMSALLALGQNQGDFGVVDKGEMNFWLCADGYVHKFLLDYEGHNQKDATQKGAMKLTWHSWDFGNAAISVTVPKDAKPLPGSN